MSNLLAPTGWITKTPKEVSRGVVNQYWQQIRPEGQAELTKPAKTMLYIKGLPNMGEQVVAVRLLELYQGIGQAHYKVDFVARQAMAMGLGQIYHEGKLITSWEELSPKDTGDNNPSPKAIRTNSAYQPTAHLWKPTFKLPGEGEKIADYQQFCLIRDNIGRDLAAMLTAKAETVKLADIGIELCLIGQKRLEEIAPGWAVVGNLTEEVAKIQKALEGLQALGDNDPVVAAVIQRQHDRLATAKTHLAAATQAAQEGKVWVLEPTKEPTKKLVGKTKANGD